jgi:heat shock protein HtpX
MANYVKTALLLAALSGLILFIGNYIGGQRGLTIALIMAGLMNFVSYFFSDKIALAMYGAQPVTREEAPDLYQIVENLTARIGMPMPKIYIIPSESPNAFATGRNPSHASVAVTEGILKILNREELEGVLAHEISHVKNRDILISTIAATMATAIMYLAHMMRFAAIFGGGYREGDRDREGGGSGLGFILVAILAPIAAMLIQLAISRSREYGADATGAHLAGHPYGLASALEKIQKYSMRVPLQATPATAHMFIVQPLTGGEFLMNLFSTHPPIEKRVARLLGRD